MKPTRVFLRGHNTVYLEELAGETIVGGSTETLIGTHNDHQLLRVLLLLESLDNRLKGLVHALGAVRIVIRNVEGWSYGEGTANGGSLGHGGRKTRGGDDFHGVRDLTDSGDGITTALD